MDSSTRIFLTCIALTPLMYLLLPLPAMGAQITGAGAGSAGSLLAFVASFRRQSTGQRRNRKSNSLLLGKLPESQRRKLPDQNVMRQELETLDALTEAENSEVPMDRNRAIAEILERFRKTWKITSVSSMRGSEVVELFFLSKLLRASAGEAGRMAQLFHRPDAILALKDDIDVIAERRANWDSARAAYVATQCLFNQQRDGIEMPSLLASLRTLSAPDPDLWHYVIKGYDITKAAQRAAALWCLQQPQCEKATAAEFLSKIGRADIRVLSALRHDMGFVLGARDVIRRWNAGGYAAKSLAFAPPADHRTQGLATVCREVARLTATSQTLLPHKLFEPLVGRPALDRTHWHLASGHMRRAPSRANYFP